MTTSNKKKSTAHIALWLEGAIIGLAIMAIAAAIAYIIV
jgi:hypothetical protein